MAALFKGAISFGLVYIPVSLYSATKEGGISFNQLHRGDKSRIRYKKVCGHCGKEVENKDIVKGYEFAKDQYVVIEDSEIEKLKTEKDRTVTILSFVSLEEISPVYYEKPYFVVPQKGGGKALELLRQAMLEEKKAALGKTVFQNGEKLLVLIPREDGMLVQTLKFHEDIKELPVEYEKPKVSNEELEIAKKLITGMEKPFTPEEYRDEFREKVKALIESKIEGKQVEFSKEEKPQKVLDLLDALRASVKSLDSSKQGKKPPQKVSSRRKNTRKEA